MTSGDAQEPGSVGPGFPPPPPPPPAAAYGSYGAAAPPGMFVDTASGLTLPNGTELASIGRRIGAWFLSIVLAVEIGRAHAELQSP